MTAAILNDREMLKLAIIDAMEERPELFKSLLKEIIAEGKASILTEEEAHLQELDAIITNDFKRFDKVFKALA
jgi:hypothetical protein